jgi:hypothetical protein
MAASGRAVPPRNGDFVGRAHLLDAIRAALTTSESTVVLHGAEGVGKSQIAIEYAYRHAADYELVWWVPAGHPLHIRIALVDLATRLGQLVVPDLRAALPAVQAADPDETWLLIFDNAGAPEDVLPLVPAGRAHVLLTTQNPHWPRPTVDVSAFSRSESRQLLRRWNDSDAGRLAAALGDMPLAVAACAAEVSMPADDYLRLLDEKLLDPLAAAAAVSVDLLRARNPSAYESLRVCAFLAPDYASRSHPTLASTSDFPAFRLHSLMQKAVRDQFTESELTESRHLVHLVLARADRSAAASHAALICHVQASEAADCADPEVRRLVSDTADRLLSWDDPDTKARTPPVAERRAQGDFASARDLAGHKYTQARSRSGDQHPATLAAADEYALSLRLCGEAEAARRLDETTWHRKVDIFGDGHRQTLATLANLAADEMVCGDWLGAFARHQRVHRRYTEQFGRYHPLTFLAAKNLAVAQRRAGDPAGALPVAQTALDGLVSCYGESQPDALSAAMSVSVTLRQIGRLEEARQLGVHVHRRYERTLGARHPFTYAAATNLAVTLHALGELSTARGLNEKALNGMRVALGRKHPLSLVCAINLTNDLARGGRYDLARDLGTVTLDQARRASPENHPWTLAAATNLVLDMRGMGELDESAELQQDTVARLSRRLGPEHPMTLGAYDNLRAFGDIDVPRI